MRKIMDTYGGGLNKLKHDGRDFPLAGLYKQIPIAEVPLGDWVVAHPLAWKDQRDTDFCSAYAGTEVSEDQEGEELLPEYNFFKTKLISGDAESWGADLRDACKSFVTYGSLPLKGYEKYRGLPRSMVVDPATWHPSLDTEAAKRSKATYFSATAGRYDLFDNLRTHLWQHRKEKCTVVTGTVWRRDWTDAPNGVIPTTRTTGEFGHAMKFYGQKLINGQPYIVAQLSNGTDIGDRGKFYFPREVVNREFGDYGAFMFKDIDRDTAEIHLQQGTKITTDSTLCRFIKRFFKQFLP